MKSFVEASRVLHCCSSGAVPYIRDYCIALSAMARLIANALQRVFKACLLQVNSHTELYHFLISLGAFKVAESVRQSETGTKTITREVVASCMTKISPQMCVASKRCVSRHNDLYHQILGTMFAWGCEIAESFDQDGSYGIDASI